VGLATAFQLTKARPDLRVCVVDKEDGPARHQSGHNSGVIHSGIYYKPGSAKALNCRKGYRYLLDFCDEHAVNYDICGKVIVATNEEEQSRLDSILQRGLANGLGGIRKISAEELREIEPHVQGREAIWVPQTGIIDFKDVAGKYLELVLARGGEALFGARVTGIREEGSLRIVSTTRGEISSRVVINCAGLYSDRIARMTQPGMDMQIIPFRGEYYKLVRNRQSLVRNLIYPVPNPNFPFLGVHFTRMINGGVEAGPNAVLAFKREGYSRWDFDPGELWQTLAFPGFRKIAMKYWRDGLDEMRRSYSKRAFVRALQRLIPEITESDLQRGGAGVRAMACDPEGNLIDDFVIVENHNAINVGNAPSPAATASLAIGETIAGKALMMC
jgi:(S)-2-hydroxyglutarate dehydrogenase